MHQNKTVAQATKIARAMLTKIVIRTFILCAVVGTMFLVNTSNVLCMPYVWAMCANGGSNKPCGECYGLKPYGTGRIMCGQGGAAIDYGLDVGLTNHSIHTSQTTNVFFLDNEADSSIKTGTGFIDATVIYNHQYYDIVDSVYKTVDAYILCDAIEIEDYHQWYETCELMHHKINSSTDKAFLFPNPTSGNATITLNPDYINVCKVQEVTYTLLTSNGEVLTTFTAETPKDIVTISAQYLTTNGIYYIECNVIKQHTGIDMFTLTLSSQK